MNVMFIFALVVQLCDGVTVHGAALEHNGSSLCLSLEEFEGARVREVDPLNLALCGMVKPLRLQAPGGGVVAFYGSSKAFVALGVSPSLLWLATTTETLVYNASLNPDKWSVFCAEVSERGKRVRVALEGAYLTTAATNRTDRSLGGYSGLCLGSPEQHFPSLLSSVASVSVQPADSARLREDDTNCSKLVNSGAAVAFGPLWSVKGNVVVLDYSEKELCSDCHHDLVVKELGKYEKSRKLCQALGGNLPFEEQVLKEPVGIGKRTPADCITSQGHVGWVETEGEVPSENLTAECRTLLASGAMGSFPCISELKCNVCRVPAWLRYTLYGSVKSFDRYYFIKPLSGGNFSFEGLETSIISKKEGYWTLQSRLHSHWWRLEGDSLPVGRHVWRSERDNVTLTLTACTPSHFTTNEGFCLHRSHRCDGRPDTPDGSDELQCRERLLDVLRVNDRKKSPFHGRSQKGVLYFSFDFFHIKQMKTEERVIHIDMGLLLMWDDPRLRFRDIRNTQQYLVCDKIWYPSVGMIEGFNMGGAIDIRGYNTVCYVDNSARTQEQYDLLDAFTGKSIEGKFLNITMYLEFRVSVPCLFELHRYPFGTYECNSSFFLKKWREEMQWKSIETGKCAGQPKYRGNHNLLDYRLLSITYDVPDGDFVVLTFHLRGQFTYHLLNSFSPSALMFIICYSTLFFPLENFNERIMVSLTAMLVLAAFFAQATDSYVKTPYFKLLDVWYAVLISLCFGCVMMNAIVNGIRVRTTTLRRCTRVVKAREIEISSSETDRLAQASVVNLVAATLIMLLFVVVILVVSLVAAEVI